MKTLMFVVVLAVAFAAGSSVFAQDPEEPVGVVERLIQEMPARDKVAQLFIVGFSGPVVGEEERAFIAEHKVGGVYINREACNIVNGPDLDPVRCGFSDTATLAPDQVRELTQDLQQASCDATAGTVDGRPYCLPMFISVDHEGDDRPLTRLLNGFTSIPSSMAIGATFEPQQAENIGCIVGRELAAVGVNMLFGPTLDVLDSPRSGGPGDQGTRSFGGDPGWVGEMGAAYITGVHECGGGAVATVAKHFPGHGRSTRRVDYEDIPVVVGKMLEELVQVDLAPFRTVAGGDPGTGPITDGIMNSHLSYRDIAGCEGDAPITFSATCMATFMGVSEFADWRDMDGLTVADDLAAGAVRAYAQRRFGTYLQGNIVEEALLAGNDLLPLIRPWQWRDLGPTIDFLVLRYEADALARARIDDAVRRVLELKLRLTGSFDVEAVTSPLETAGPVDGAGMVNALTAKSATFISPTSMDAYRRATSAPGVGQQILFVECWDDPTCAPPSTADYPPLWPKGKLAELSLELFPGRVSEASMKTISFAELDAVLLGAAGDARTAVEDADWIVFAFLERDPAAYRNSEALKDFLGRGPALFDLRDKQIVVFAYHSPYHLDAGELRNVDLFVALYSKIEPALRTSLRILFQDPSALRDVGGGRLPVDYIYGDLVLYDLSREVAADPGQSVQVVVEPEEVAPGEEFTVKLAAPLLARNGHRVADGTSVVFTLTLPDETQVERSAVTSSGLAEVTFRLSQDGQDGDLPITVESGGSEWTPDNHAAVRAAPSAEEPAVVSSDDGGGVSIALVASTGAAVALAAAAGGVFVLRRRRRQAVPATVGAEGQPLDAEPGVLQIDPATRRVLIAGAEVDPPLSKEQFQLLSYLHGRAGEVCSREEIIEQVWPEVDASGVSDQAVDSLVHRTRERLRSAGAEKQLIVTVRGQGFRLEL
ncbi:MAG: winged helix-turn-helix domain-containing protein [Chloroflexi bacterium]|nr:winged helix-turn-helix domain-containing protein [Chloroflexota bacterium]